MNGISVASPYWFMVFCLMVFMHHAFGYEETLTVHSNCIYEIHYANEDKSYKVVWTGVDPSAFGCKIGFHGRDTSDYSKNYKICVEAKTFYLQSTGIRLKYSTGFLSSLARTYVRGDDPEKYCTESDGYLDVEVEADSTLGSFGTQRIDTSRSYFTLEVTAHYTSTTSIEEWTAIGAIVGGVIGGLVLIGIVVTVVIIVVCSRRRGSRGQTYRQNTVPQQGTQSAYPTNSTTTSYPTQPGMGYPPQPTTGLSNQYGQQNYGFNGQPAEQGNAYAPPSYSQLQSSDTKTV